ncbi:MAG: hypothetical protein GQ553_01845 [Nitrosomonadaceae bacterium]|nr:hypothetical protein [Nitrosomonadaceae bacterium]
MKTSLVQLKKEFRIIADAHEQINSFFWGAPDRAVLESTLNYPLMCCYVTAAPVNISRRVTSVSIAVVVVDKVYKNYVSLDDTVSDTLRVIRDVQNTLHSPRWLSLIRKPTASGSKIFNNKQDEVSGWGIQFKIDIKDDGSYCNLPMSGYDFDAPESTPIDCLPSTIINSTATYLQEVDSGATFQLPDVTNIDTDGTPVVTPAQTPFICSTPTGIAYRNVAGTGQWTSYRTGDEGYHVQLGTYQRSFTGVKTELDYSTPSYFVTMLNNNAFGNTSRFTNDLGGTVTDGSDGSTALYVIDHDTGLGWDIDIQLTGNWNASIDYANARTVGPYSGFRLPTLNEVESITDVGRPVNVHDYPIFNLTQAFLSGTTFAASTGRIFVVANNADFALLNKTVSYRSITVRNHY